MGLGQGVLTTAQIGSSADSDLCSDTGCLFSCVPSCLIAVLIPVPTKDIEVPVKNVQDIFHS